MIVPIRPFLKDRRANAATEFAFILPIMLLFISAIVEFGRIYQAYDAVNRLATRYASVYAECNDNIPSAVACSNTAPGELVYYWPSAAVGNIAPQLTNTSTISIRMFEVLISATGVPTVNYSQPSGLTWANLSSTEQQRATAAIFTGTNPETGVVVTVQYTHQLLFFPSLIQQYIPINLRTVSYTVAQRKT